LSVASANGVILLPTLPSAADTSAGVSVRMRRPREAAFKPVGPPLDGGTSGLLAISQPRTRTAMTR
jgi:hypothetical protein